MEINKNKVNSIIEYILLALLFIIGMNKGGYYKADSIIGVLLIEFITSIYFIFNSKEARKTSSIAKGLVGLSLAYFLPILFGNAATISGAFNIWSRIYSAALIYLVVFNSNNKEKFKNAIITFSVIFSILGIDEITGRVFSTLVKIIGGGYVAEISNVISSVFQYSNLLGILNVVSVLLIQSRKVKKEDKIKNSILNGLKTFLEITIFLTGSKMAITLLILSKIIMCIVNKEYRSISKEICKTIFSGIVYTLALNYNVIIFTIIGVLISVIYDYLTENYINKIKTKNIVNIILIILMLIGCICFINLIKNTNNYERIESYFENYESTYLRIEYYKTGSILASNSLKNLFLGMGGNSFRSMYETAQNFEYISLEVHSLFMQILIESGLIGLSIFVYIIYCALFKAKGKNEKIIICTVLTFAAFDVFLTYTFMLYLLVVLFGLLEVKEKRLGFYSAQLNMAYYCANIVINIVFAVAFLNMPIIVDNVNNSFEKQNEIVKNCGIACMLDPWDIEYRRTYNKACVTCLDILDIKNEMYGIDDTSKREKLINTIYNNVSKEVKNEKSNKYALEDYAYYTCKYIDELVVLNYEKDLKQGYEYYLENIVLNMVILREEHPYNELANQMYNNTKIKVIDKFKEVNLILNSDKITELLSSI